MLKARPILVLLGTAPLFFAYPPFDRGWLAWVALLPLLALARGPRPWAVGFLAGLFFHGFALAWVSRLSWVGWALLVAYLSLYPALLLSLSKLFSPRFFALKLACAGVVLEYAAGSFLSGFPWFPLGITQYRNELLLGVAPLGGVWLVSGLVYLVNGALFSFFAFGSRKSPLAAALVLALFLAGPRLFERESAIVPGAAISLALVQGNVPSSLRAQGPMLEPYADLTREMAGRPDLVIWPETTFAAWEALLPGEVAPLLAGPGAYLLSGVLEYNDENGRDKTIHNSAVLYHPSGRVGAVYRKRHLVPYGEYIPGRRFRPVRFLVERDAGFLPSITPGTGSVVMSAAGFTFLPLVCYESVFPELVAGSFPAGPRYLPTPVMVVLTNDSWLGRLGGGQHFAASTFRAAENRAWLVRVANTGVTAVIDDRGRIVSRLPTDLPGILEYRLSMPPVTGVTFFQSRPRAFPAASALVLLLVLAGEARGRRREGPEGGPGYFRPRRG